MKNFLKILLPVTLGSALYAAATQFFIFSNDLFLGGTSGLSVILSHFFPRFSSGQFLMFINIGLMVLALLILGKRMALGTMLGSTLTTVFIGFLDSAAPMEATLIASPVLAAIIGSMLIAIASAVLFLNDSSSGGTDIIALIIQKFSSIQIGTALMIADILIVVIGALVSPIGVAIGSVVGLIVKTRGIDIAIALYKRIKKTL
ncbi:MAG: YitT family protein [Clostridia bacterium]|nr:YitT family protein [Clostridia bacterium]